MFLDGKLDLDKNNNLKSNIMAEQVKTLQDFIKEHPNDLVEAVKQYLIYTNRFGGEIKTN